jgi:hypothetical protein
MLHIPALDLKSIRDDIACPADSDLKAGVLTILLSLLEGYQSVQDAVKEVNTLYSTKQPCSTKQPWHYGTEAYDTEAYDMEAYDTEAYDTEAYDTEAYDTVDFLWTLWGAMFSIVRILPYNHPKQELFVEFLVLLRRGVMGTATVWGVCVPYFSSSHLLKFMVRLIKNLFQAEMRIWRDLPLLGPCLREEWGCTFILS